MTLIAKVADIITAENLHCTKLSAQLNISREVLQRILSGKQKAGQGVLSKLEQFVQQYESGQFDLSTVAKPRKAKKVPHVLKENEVYISGTDWKYTVDTEGQIYSVRYDRYLQGHVNKGGYIQVEICGTSYYAHRIVATAFLDNTDNLPEVNHKNGNTADNSVCNLEWISSKDNILHSILNGFFKGRGVNQIDQDGTVIAKYSQIIEASRATGIHATSIVKCCKGKMRTSGGYRWEYKTIYAGKRSQARAGNESQVLTGSLMKW